MMTDKLTHIDLVSCRVGDAQVAFLSHHVLSAKRIADNTSDKITDLASCLAQASTSNAVFYQLELYRTQARTQIVRINGEMVLLNQPLSQIFSLPTLLKQRNTLPGLIALAYHSEQQQMLNIIDPTLWND